MPDAREAADLETGVGSPILSGMLRYWESKRRRRAMPARADLDPADIVPLLPHLGIVEFSGARLRCALLGTAIAEAFGVDHTGRHFDEFLAGERLRFFERLFRQIAEQHCPIYVENVYPAPNERPVTVRRLILPLSNDGVTVNKTIVAMDIGAPRLRRDPAFKGTVTVRPLATSVDDAR